MNREKEEKHNKVVEEMVKKLGRKWLTYKIKKKSKESVELANLSRSW